MRDREVSTEGRKAAPSSPDRHCGGTESSERKRGRN